MRPIHYKILAVVESIFILAVIPWARVIQRYCTGIWEWLAIPSWLIQGVIVAAGLCLAGILIRRWRALPFAIPIVAVIVVIKPLPIEYSHLLTYGSLFILVRGSFSAAARYPAIKSIAICMVVSALDEGGQWLHPERFADWRDMALNFTGALCGYVILKILSDRSPKPSQPPVITKYSPQS